MIIIKVKYEFSYKGHNRKALIDEPSECPCCKHFIKPTILHKEAIDYSDDSFSLYVVYLCTHCYEPFICKFVNFIKDSAFSTNSLYSSCNLSSIEPRYFEKKIFENYISELSPSFVKIYNQTLEAEHYNLDEIAGIGYRKALEFLIKDFLIKHEHIDESKVKSTALGCCIDTMISNPQLKTASSRATWLGNDQTHYEQKYTDKDIDDLKRLIDLSVHWISMIYLTDEANLIEKK